MLPRYHKHNFSFLKIELQVVMYVYDYPKTGESLAPWVLYTACQYDSLLDLDSFNPQFYIQPVSRLSIPRLGFNARHWYPQKKFNY